MPAQKRSFDEKAAAVEEEDGDPIENGHVEQPPQGGVESDMSRSSDDDDGEKDEYVAVRLSEIRKEVQCPICLGIIRKTRTVMECLHRFCRQCIDKSMRLGNNECPACRTHCASRRSLRDDPKYDALIAALYPDIDKYEEEELAFHEEEMARNKQIQATIAQAYRRQSEAQWYGKKRASAKVTAAVFMRKSQGNYKNLRGRRSHKNAVEVEISDDNDEEANDNDGGKYSSSADERTEPRRKIPKRWTGPPYYQRSSATANADDYYEKDSEVNGEAMGSCVGFLGSPESLSWGKGGLRSHTRYGSSSGANGKNARSRISKLADYLRNSKANDHDKGLDIRLLLVSFDEQRISSLHRRYLCCRPTLSIRQLCQYVADQTALQPDEVEIYLTKEGQVKINSSDPTISPVFTSGVLGSSKDAPLLLRDDESLAEVQARDLTRRHLILAYQKKWNSRRG